MQNLKPAWNAILDVYREYSRLCDENGLKHWIAYGSLIGTVRHKGFIPWDDDLDVFMPRPDYERFQEIAEQSLPSYLKIVKWDNCRQYNYLFCKVQDTRKDVYDATRKASGLDLPQGIYIDIFPLDGTADSSFANAWEACQRKLLYMRYTALFRKGHHRSVKGWLAEFLGHGLAVLFPGMKTEKDFTARMYKWSRRHPFEGSKKCGFFFTLSGGWEWTAPTEIFAGTDYLPFDDFKVPCPIGWHVFLTRMYGDYMTPPPPEKQVSCHWGEAPWKFGPTGL